MRFLIVEPHADDAFLSLGSLMESWAKDGHEVLIVTVYSGTRKRAADAEAYATAIGARWFGLGYEEIGHAVEKNEAAPIEGSVGKLLERVSDLYDYDYVILPLGVGGHPEHVMVVEHFIECLPPNVSGLAYYVEQPYASKLKNQPALQSSLTGKQILFVRKPGAVKWRHSKLFKDQAKFFHFNDEESLSKTFELVVR